MNYVAVTVLLALTATIIAPPGAFVAAAAGPETVFLIVELKDSQADLDEKDWRNYVREIRQISDRAPRSYVADGRNLRTRDLRRWRVVEVDASEADNLLTKLRGSPAVASVRVEQIYQTTRTPNDSFFTNQYALSGNNSPFGVQASSAWEKTVGVSTVIAVIDGGVDLTHEDLAAKAWQNGSETKNGVDDDGNGFIDDVNGWDFVDDTPAVYGHEHATHVAGIAAAQTDNGRGIAGANWQAKIMSVRVLNRSGIGREENIIRGIDYAVAEGADIINLSLAGSASSAMLDAVENAYANGVLVVAAAGNNGSSRPVYPACAERNGVNMVLGVGATNDKGEPASFSNWGDCVDVSAPGDDILSSTPGSRYREMSGTSMSAPLAAGIAGLYLAQHPNASPSEIISRLQSSLDPFVGKNASEHNQRYKGILNAAKVVGAAVITPAPTASPTPSSSATPLLQPAVLNVDLTGPVEAALGSELKYDIKVENSGGPAMNVLVELDSERELKLVGGACQLIDKDIVCLLGNMSAGESRSIAAIFSVGDEIRCGKTFTGRAEVFMQDDKGRSRRQERSERVRTSVSCD